MIFSAGDPSAKSVVCQCLVGKLGRHRSWFLSEVKPDCRKDTVDGMRLEPVEDHAFDVGLLVGSHTVQVAKEGYRTHTSEASIETAKTTTLSIELERQ